MKPIIITLFIALNFYSQSQTSYLFNIKGEAGTMFPGVTTWIFTKDPSRWLADKQYTIYPGYYFGIGIESKDLISVDNLGLCFGLDVSYGRSSTGEVEFRLNLS